LGERRDFRLRHEIVFSATGTVLSCYESYSKYFKSKRNIVQGKSFMDMLYLTIKKYTNRNVEAAQVIKETVRTGKKPSRVDRRDKRR